MKTKEAELIIDQIHICHFVIRPNIMYYEIKHNKFIVILCALILNTSAQLLPQWFQNYLYQVLGPDNISDISTCSD